MIVQTHCMHISAQSHTAVYFIGLLLEIAGDIYGLGVPTHTEQRHIFCDVLIMEELNSVDEVSE